MHSFSIVRSVAQLKCIYTDACSIGNKQEELEIIVQQKNYHMSPSKNLVESHNWSAATSDGYKLFRKVRQGRRGGAVAMLVRECFGFVQLNASIDKAESLWVRRWGKVNKVDILVGVCYGLPTQDERQIKYSTSC